MKRKLIQSNITTAPGLSIWDLRQLAINEPKDFVHKITVGAEEGKFRFAELTDLRALYQALADVPVTVHINDVGGSKRAVGTTAFPILVGNVVIAGINEAYMGVETIGQLLVTEFDDNKKVSIIVRVEALDKEVDEVKEDMDFPQIGVEESGVEIRHRRNGRKFTILKEAIEENDITNIAGKINGLGDLAANRIEELTLKRVYDYDASKSSSAEPYAYRPQSGATALYSATANTPGTKAPSGNQINSNAFEDESDLENARVRLATMKNANGKRITVPRSEIGIVCPDAVVGKVLKVRNSEYVPGIYNEVSNYGPIGKWNIPIERIWSSPKVDDLSATCWLYGAPARQFMRKWKLRFEYVTLGQNTQAYLNSRVAFQASLRWDCEVGAVDYVFVIRNLSATTAPADE